MLDAELPSSSTFLPCSHDTEPQPVELNRRASSVGAVVPLLPVAALKDAQSPSACAQPGRRQRAQLADWGGSNLADVLGPRRERTRATSVTRPEEPSCMLPSRTRLSRAVDVASWGGSLDQVLTRPEPAAASRDTSASDFPVRSTSSSSQARGRHRVSNADFGGGLGDVLAAPRRPVDRYAEQSQVDSSPPQPERRPPRPRVLSPGHWQGSLGEVLRPQVARQRGQPTMPAPEARAVPPQPWQVSPQPWQGSLDEVFRPQVARQREPAAAPTPEQQPRSASVAWVVSVPGWEHDGDNVSVVEVTSRKGPRAEAATPKKKRARSRVVRPGDTHSDCCSICLDDFHVRQRLTELPCKHCFHVECLRSYFNVADVRRCPCCRSDCSNIVI